MVERVKELIAKIKGCSLQDVTLMYYTPAPDPPKFCNNNLCVLSQEISRNLVRWNLYKITDEYYNLEDPLLDELLTFEIFYLAGGSVTGLVLDKPVKDYDLFIVSSDFSAVGIILDKIRAYKHPTIKTVVESRNCITIIRTKKTMNPIQIIKRVYDRPDRIIGGFDLDICRLILIGGYVYGTAPALYAVENKIIIVNLKCASKNFRQRIKKYSNKYRLKTFHPYLMSIELRCGIYYKKNYMHKMSDYFQISDTTSLGIKRHNTHQLKNGGEDFIYEKDEILEPEEFVQHTAAERRNQVNILLNYYKYAEGLAESKKLLYVNTHTQFTASFSPVEISPKEFYPQRNIFKLNFITRELMIFFLVLYEKKIPKYLRYIILLFAVENYIISNMMGD